jgi:hypothetical protein
MLLKLHCLNNECGWFGAGKNFQVNHTNSATVNACILCIFVLY